MLKKQLDAMVGKTYLYQTNQVKLLSYRIDGDQLILVTDKKWIHKSISGINGLLSDFLEVDEPDPVTDIVRANLNQTSKSVSVVRDALIDNIQKIQEDPSYIPQANEIQKSAKSLIELVKTEVEVAKIIAKK